MASPTLRIRYYGMKPLLKQEKSRGIAVGVGQYRLRMLYRIGRFYHLKSEWETNQSRTRFFIACISKTCMVPNAHITVIAQT